jgi:hypothetical protein
MAHGFYDLDLLDSLKPCFFFQKYFLKKVKSKKINPRKINYFLIFNSVIKNKLKNTFQYLIMS